MKHLVIGDKDSNVFKHVFEKEDAVYESVMYRYGSFEKRTVICCSTQSGCRVACAFCGTGRQFVRDLTTDEIVQQVSMSMEHHGVNDYNVEKFQIMFMSMGEPMHNFEAVEKAINILNIKYPSAQLLISTSGVKGKAWVDLIRLSKKIDKIGLQLSIHASNDDARNKIIPFKDKFKLRELRGVALEWSRQTGRQVYLNYCVNGVNCGTKEFEELTNMFNPYNFAFTFSVICSKDENLKDAGYNNLDKIREFQQNFVEEGYNTRVFNPEGQDNYGAGCGQLWYVQKWMKENQDKVEKN